MEKKKRIAAFTLIELIITMALMGILAYLGSRMLMPVMRGYLGSREKTLLFNEAQFTLSRIARELRNAVPNSIRVGDGYIQFCKFRAASYYNLISSDNFTYYGSFDSVKRGDYLSIYNTAPEYLYSRERVYEVLDVNGNMVEVNKAINPSSPYHRVYLISTPVTFYLKNGKIYRSFDYQLSLTDYGIDEGKYFELADHISELKFTYLPGNYKHSAVISIFIKLAKNDIIVQYQQEVHTRNVP